MWASLLQLLNKIASAFIDYLPDIIKNRKRKKLEDIKKSTSSDIEEARNQSLNHDVKSVNDRTLEYIKNKDL